MSKRTEQPIIADEQISKLKLHLFWIHLVFGRWSSVVVQICPKCPCIYGFVNKF